MPSVAALSIAPAEFEAAERALAVDVRAALAYAAERIERYHAAALPKSWRITDEHGSVLGQEIRPLDRVGVYIPGGRAAYPSTVLRSEEHTSELQSRLHLVCRLLLEKKK